MRRSRRAASRFDGGPGHDHRQRRRDRRQGQRNRHPGTPPPPPASAAGWFRRLTTPGHRDDDHRRRLVHDDLRQRLRQRLVGTRSRSRRSPRRDPAGRADRPRRQAILTSTGTLTLAVGAHAISTMFGRHPTADMARNRAGRGCDRRGRGGQRCPDQRWHAQYHGQRHGHSISSATPWRTSAWDQAERPSRPESRQRAASLTTPGL